MHHFAHHELLNKDHPGELGNNNLTDILDYCKENDIEYLTTLDFLAEVYGKPPLTEAECDHFIYLADTKGKIPYHSIDAYIASF